MKIIDIGMYDGSDTDYYLRCGHEVIAIEANPSLCEKATRRFSRYVASGSLVVLNLAIGPGDFLDLNLSGDDLGSSSIQPERVADRSPVGTCRVKAALLPEIIAEHGQPDFVKIDIEGADRDCVLSLTPSIAPQYLSFEAPQEIEDLISHLQSLGYTQFKAVNQTSFRSLDRHERLADRLVRRAIRALGYDEPRYVRRKGACFALEHSAGPPPWESDGRYRSAEQLLTEWTRTPRGGWYDIHAERPN